MYHQRAAGALSYESCPLEVDRGMTEEVVVIVECWRHPGGEPAVGGGQGPMRVVVAEDSYLIREALGRLLSADPRVQVEGLAVDYDSPSDWLASSVRTWSLPMCGCRRLRRTRASDSPLSCGRPIPGPGWWCSPSTPSLPTPSRSLMLMHAGAATYSGTGRRAGPVDRRHPPSGRGRPSWVWLAI